MLARYRLRNTKMCLSSVVNNTSVTNYIQSVLAQGIRLFPGPENQYILMVFTKLVLLFKFLHRKVETFKTFKYPYNSTPLALKYLLLLGSGGAHI